MFNKLRNHFLFLNLVLISVVMISSFSIIYIVTYKNVQRDIDMDIKRISDFNRSLDRPVPSEREPSAPRDTLRVPPEPSLSFSLILSTSYSIVETSSFFPLEDYFYEEASNRALEQEKNKGRIKLEDKYWTYLIKPHFEEGFRIVFLDITTQVIFLRNLVYTFLAVSIATLFIIFLISRFFANKAIEPIKEAFEKQRQFLADASHELKTPLTVMSANLDVLSQEMDLQESKWIRYIKDEIARMAGLVNDLLYLAQMDYEEDKIEFSIFDFSELAESTALSMEGIVYEKNMYINYSIKESAFILGNTDKLKQVIIILLENALKYSFSQTEIELSLEKTNSSAILTVSNFGDGISSEDIPKIFDRFYKADFSRERKGTGYGLGLSIAQAIVKMHNGKISVYSVPSEKTTFKVELPLAKKS